MKFVNFVAAFSMVALISTSSVFAASQPTPRGVGKTQPLSTFEADSLPQIIAAQQGKPFVLMMWSLDCRYCKQNFEALSNLRKHRPRLSVVTIAMDAPEASAKITQILKRYQLTQNAWVFGSVAHERLRFALDSDWMGEMPRTYFYRADGTRRGVSGALAPTQWSENFSWMKNSQ